MLNPKVELILLLFLGQYTQQAIRDNEFRRWRRVIDAGLSLGFSLNAEDTAKYEAIINAQLKPGMPDF